MHMNLIKPGRTDTVFCPIRKFQQVQDQQSQTFKTCGVLVHQQEFFQKICETLRMALHVFAKVLSSLHEVCGYRNMNVVLAYQWKIYYNKTQLACWSI